MCYDPLRLYLSFLICSPTSKTNSYYEQTGVLFRMGTVFLDMVSLDMVFLEMVYLVWFTRSFLEMVYLELPGVYLEFPGHT